MSTQVGVIDLGLDIDRNAFNRQLNGIARGAERSSVRAFGGLGKKIGTMLGIAAVTAFTKQCLSMGSALSEVQNVVDVTFGALADDINRFANTAITQFGLSETAAKKYASTIGAMLKSMGIGTQQAVEMAKVTAGLSADMASFYNLTSEEAFGKIRAGLSGETEPLKQLGINMSVANLEAFALSQGLTKAYNKMSQQEQVMLRYNYLLKATADAQGDFARTSDSWANQTRILSEQFKALQASIGQGLIAALTPVIKSLNVLMAKLVQAGNTFKNFMELIFGKGSSNGGVGQVAEDVASITEGASGAGDAITGMGDATADAAKKARGALAGFDEINDITQNATSGEGSGGNLGGVESFDFGEAVTGTDQVEKSVLPAIDKMIEHLQILKDEFMKGFNIGFVDKDIQPIKDSVSGIKESVLNITQDQEVQKSANDWAGSWLNACGKVTGAVASVGVTVAKNITGGIDKYLLQNLDFIKDRFVGILDASSGIADYVGRFATVIADIFSVFGSESAQQITANIIGMFSNAFLGVVELATKWGRDLISCIVVPIEENKDKIKLALENTLKPIETVTTALSNLVTSAFESVLNAYDTYVAPAYENIRNGISTIVGALLDAYNKYFAPTIDAMSKKWAEFYEESLSPVIDKACEVIGKLFFAFSELYENCIAPFVAWCIDYMAPYISSAFEKISESFRIAAQFITDTIGGLLEIFGGLIDFLMGVFTGDWELVWDGCKQILSGICSTFKAMFIDPFNNIINYLKNSFTTAWENAWNGVSKIFKGVFDGLVTIAKGPINLIIEAINTLIRGLNKIQIKPPDWISDVPGMGWLEGKSFGVNIPTIPKLAKGGVVDQPTLAMVGEAGKEAVVPLRNNTEWTGEVAGLLMNAMLPLIQAMQGGGNNNDTNRDIVIEVGGVELVRAFLPDLLRELRRKGIEL